ncbi:MAG: carboxypeptidase-like regulatory domain-containing protein, partial [Acidobacteriota bacterium]|nr:carboxypeptidase-like regulatory domain-containing protein [Acidobacteriota bacterium]
MRTLLICLLLGVLTGQQPVLGQVGGLPQAPPRDVRAEPASRVQVQALLLRAGAQPTPSSSAATDDRGEFRLFHLTPGDYIVMAMTPNNIVGPEVEGEAIGFASSYSPGVPTMAEAARVRIGPASQATADIRLIETRVHTLNGTVVTASGEPARGGNVSLIARESPLGPMFATGLSGTGTFSLRNVPPGSYELIARHQAPRPAGALSTAPASAQEFGRQPVEVVAHTEVLLPLTLGAVVQGEAVFDETPPAGTRVNVTPTTLDPRNLTGVPSVEVTGSQFTLRGAFGPLLLRANASGGAAAWALKAVLLRGHDITDEPTVLTASDSGHLQVVFTSKAPALEGVVTGQNGQPSNDATIVIFAHDPKAWTPLPP